MNVGDWIKKWSLLCPQKTALFFENRFFSYQELNRRINQLCHLLLGMGVRKGDRVAVLLQNCHQYIEILFALSKIGAIFVPLNWRLAGPELLFLIQDSGSRMLILEPEFEEVVASIRPHLPPDYLCVGSPCPNWARDYERGLLENVDHEPSLGETVGDEDPHMIMYTSGTTGVPKGAILSHRKTFFNVLNADIFYHLTPKDVMVITRPLFHSGGLLVDAAPVLYKGGTLIFKKRFRTHEIFGTIERHRVTVVEMAGTLFQ